MTFGEYEMILSFCFGSLIRSNKCIKTVFGMYQHKYDDTVESRYINEGHGDLHNMFLVRHVEASPLTKPFQQLQIRDKL